MESIEGFNVNHFKIGHLPTLFYIPDFITDADESTLLDNIYKAPVSKWKSLKNRRLQNWGGIVHEKGLIPQKLPTWLTTITQKIFRESSLFPAPINHVLVNEYLPNQGIMPHQDGPAYFSVVAILSLGSPVVMDFTPHSRLISCADDKLTAKVDDQDSNGTSEADRDKRFDAHQPFSIILKPRSVLIFKDDAYSDYLHGIKDSNLHCYDEVVNKADALNCQSKSETAALEDGSSGHRAIERTGTRVSLTCRLVPKVHKQFFGP